MNKQTWLLMVVAILGILFMTACTGEGAAQITPSEQDLAVLEYADPVAENIMSALNSNDYSAFSRDFDTNMLGAMGETGLAQLRDSLNAQVGDFQSLGTGKVSETEQAGVKYIVVEYPAQFAKAKVTLRLVLSAEPPYKVNGLFFR
jgi:hypothetical protein